MIVFQEIMNIFSRYRNQQIIVNSTHYWKSDYCPNGLLWKYRDCIVDNMFVEDGTLNLEVS